MNCEQLLFILKLQYVYIFCVCIYIHYITPNYALLHYITLHYMTLHYISLHCIILYFIILYYITYAYTYIYRISKNSTPLIWQILDKSTMQHKVKLLYEQWNSATWFIAYCIWKIEENFKLSSLWFTCTWCHLTCLFTTSEVTAQQVRMQSACS